jgi:hypothetical protein
MTVIPPEASTPAVSDPVQWIWLAAIAACFVMLVRAVVYYRWFKRWANYNIEMIERSARLGPGTRRMPAGELLPASAVPSIAAALFVWWKWRTRALVKEPHAFDRLATWWERTNQ